MLDIDVVIYDFDGVLIDSAAGIANSVQATQRHFATNVMDIPAIVSFVGHGAKYLIDGCLAELPEDDRKTALVWYKNYYHENCMFGTSLYPTVKETLEFFYSREIPQFIVSNKPEPITRTIVKELEAEKYFQGMYGPESLKNMKPDPEGLLKCMESCNRHKGIMVGDSYTDILAGKRAGIHTCGALYGMGNMDKLKAENADIYVNTLGEMLDYINVD